MSRQFMGPTQPPIERVLLVPTLPRQKGWEKLLGIEDGTIGNYQAPRLRMCGAIPTFPIHDFIP